MNAAQAIKHLKQSSKCYRYSAYLQLISLLLVLISFFTFPFVSCSCSYTIEYTYDCSYQDGISYCCRTSDCNYCTKDPPCDSILILTGIFLLVSVCFLIFLTTVTCKYLRIVRQGGYANIEDVQPVYHSAQGTQSPNPATPNVTGSNQQSGQQKVKMQRQNINWSERE